MNNVNNSFNNNFDEESILSVKNLEVTFNNAKENKKVLENIDLNIKKGEIVSIIGPSGCGKSTLLGAIGGINKDFEGEIIFKGKKVNEPSSDRGYIFQKPALFEWMNVEDNIGYGLKLKKFSKSYISKEVDKFLSEIGLNDYKSYYPNQLSGGMQQRVALARTLIMKPDMILMDEPFSALDYQTRLEMQNLTLKLWELYRPAILFVTHDIEEAILMADKVIVLSNNPGKISDIIDIKFERPRSIDVISKYEFMEIKKILLKKLIF